MPKISVIVPVYKVEPYIHRCIDSIIAQTFTDFELILVDDGSPDDCGRICDEYAERDSRIYVIHQENGGLSAARNAGIDRAFEKSDSEWLSFIDSDDWVHPEYLERLYNAAVEHKVAVSVCGYVETDGEEPDISVADMESHLWTPEEFYVEHNVNATVAWGKLYRKECFQTIRYPMGRIHEDEYVTYKILFDLRGIVVISNSIYYYFQNADGIMHSVDPKKYVDSLCALYDQLEYFSSFRYKRVLTNVRSRFAWTLEEYCKHRNERSAYDRLIRKIIKKILREYGRDMCLSIPRDGWIYEIAFPREMQVYWIVRARLSKLHQ